MIRIDDRLLHGQVVWGWINNLPIERVVLAIDDKNDPWIEMGKTILPDNIEFMIHEISNSIDSLNKYTESERTMILIRNLNDLYKLYKKGLKCKEVIIGGLHPQNPINKKIVYAGLTEKDIKIINELKDKIDFYFQDLPQNKRIKAEEIL